jgi:DNA-damage-inducible protein D
MAINVIPEGEDNRKLVPIARRSKGEKIAKLMAAFEAAVHHDENGEYWLARELHPLLGYKEWRNFQTAVRKAKAACSGAEEPVWDHFVDANKHIPGGKGAIHNVDDIELTRFACYLIAQNGDPTKPEIAAAQTYFAVQTRRQETADKARAQWQVARDKGKEKRTLLTDTLSRHDIKEHKHYAILTDTASRSTFGKSVQEFRTEKGLVKKDKTRDHYTEIELLQMSLTEALSAEKIEKEDRRGLTPCEQAIRHCGSSVRQGVEAARKGIDISLPGRPHDF